MSDVLLVSIFTKKRWLLVARPLTNFNSIFEVACTSIKLYYFLSCLLFTGVYFHFQPDPVPVVSKMWIAESVLLHLSGRAEKVLTVDSIFVLFIKLTFTFVQIDKNWAESERWNVCQWCAFFCIIVKVFVLILVAFDMCIVWYLQLCASENKKK